MSGWGPSHILRFNVGGTVYQTTIATVTNNEPHFLSALVLHEGKLAPNECYNIDRNGRLFEYILDYLRKGKLNLPQDIPLLRDLIDEAQFFSIRKLELAIQEQLDRLASLKYSEDHERLLDHKTSNFTFTNSKRTSPESPDNATCNTCPHLSGPVSPCTLPAFPFSQAFASPISMKTLSTSMGLATLNSQQTNFGLDDDASVIAIDQTDRDGSPQSQVEMDRKTSATRFDLINDAPLFEPPNVNLKFEDMQNATFSTSEDF